jgi:hypothetical protein
MRQILSLVAASLISLIPATGHAMTILRLDTNLILYGRSCVKIWHRSVRNCRAPVKHVVLAESRGGDLTAAYGIADLIRKNNINTSVKGYCVSSCAVMFMAGTERQIIEEKNYKTILGFMRRITKKPKRSASTAYRSCAITS